MEVEEGTAGGSSQESHRVLTGLHHGVWRAREELFGSVGMRRGHHDTVLWCETCQEGISGEISATHDRDHL
jgi:hypothetical protein